MAGQPSLRIVDSAARTTTGNSAGYQSPPGPQMDIAQNLGILIDITAVAGTGPNLVLSVEWSYDGISFAQADPADQMTAITAASKKVKIFQIKADFYRLVWTITGTTPSFTFSAYAYGT